MHFALMLLDEYFSATGYFLFSFIFYFYLQLCNILKYKLSLLNVSLIQYLHHVSTFVHSFFVFKNDKTWEM